jgi:Uma2 family endonuclease
MSANPKQTASQKMTEAEYLEFELEAEFKHEFVNGEIYTMVGASPSHIRVNDNLLFQMFLKLRGKGCTPSGNDMKVLKTGNYYHPDLTVHCGEANFLPNESIAVLQNPTMIFEILSPTTALRDNTTKLFDYQRISTLQAYVIVAQDVPRIATYTRLDASAPEWTYRVAEGLADTLRLTLLDIEISMADIYEGITFESDEPDEVAET